MKHPRFVSFEGIEGCGKTTQIARLSRYLTDRRISHSVTREPGGTAVGESIRQILLNSQTIHLTSEAELLLFYASRSQNIAEKIAPGLAQGDLVICDRFYDASMAYQGFGRGIPLGIIEELTRLVCGRNRPEKTILLDIDPELGLRRARTRNRSAARDEGRFEMEDIRFYSKVRAGYLELARREPDRIQVLAADSSIDDVHRNVLRLLGFDDGV